MTRAGLIERLVAVSCAIGKAERLAIDAENVAGLANDRLEAAEDRLLLGGTIDGKNDAIRQAQVRAETAALREQLSGEERIAEQMMANLRVARAELSVLKCLSRLMSGDDKGDE